jgi:hypothetical protein
MARKKEVLVLVIDEANFRFQACFSPVAANAPR